MRGSQAAVGIMPEANCRRSQWAAASSGDAVDSTAVVGARRPHHSPRMPRTSAVAVRIGAVAWVIAVQFFITQVAVATAWPRPFSLTTDYISDLGNTRHVLGAGLNFVAGNIAMIVYGLALAQRPGVHSSRVWFSLFSGTLGMLATLLFISGHFLGIGLGGMERVAAYPMTVWQIVTGMALLRGAQRSVLGT